jgi:hypothetical protein
MVSEAATSKPEVVDVLQIALGPADTVCVEYSDPTRLAGSNLPAGLCKILDEWTTRKSEQYSESEQESDDASIDVEGMSISDF